MGLYIHHCDAKKLDRTRDCLTAARHATCGLRRHPNVGYVATLMGYVATLCGQRRHPKMGYVATHLILVFCLSLLTWPQIYSPDSLFSTAKIWKNCHYKNDRMWIRGKNYSVGIAPAAIEVKQQIVKGLSSKKICRLVFFDAVFCNSGLSSQFSFAPECRLHSVAHSDTF